MKPIFILSLPRSGSTLLQRMLSAHSQIASVAEPWIMLPLAAITESTIKTYSTYSSRLARLAFEDLVAELPGGRATYHAAVRDMMTRLYSGLCKNGESLFLDKTPRYYLIADYLREIFPDAKVIFLFRHPLDVLSSVLNTFGRGRLTMHHAHVDVFRGPLLLHQAHARLADSALTLSYEELVNAPVTTCETVAAYLGIDYEAEMVTDYKDVRFSGSMGDRVGDTKYAGVNQGSVGAWRSVLGTVVRRAFARRYVDFLGPDVLRTFGVSADSLRAELRSLPVSWRRTLPDGFWLTASWLARRTHANVLRAEWIFSDAEVHKLD